MAHQIHNGISALQTGWTHVRKGTSSCFSRVKRKFPFVEKALQTAAFATGALIYSLGEKTQNRAVPLSLLTVVALKNEARPYRQFIRAVSCGDDRKALSLIEEIGPALVRKLPYKVLEDWRSIHEALLDVFNKNDEELVSVLIEKMSANFFLYEATDAYPLPLFNRLIRSCWQFVRRNLLTFHIIKENTQCALRIIPHIDQTHLNLRDHACPHRRTSLCQAIVSENKLVALALVARLSREQLLEPGSRYGMTPLDYACAWDSLVVEAAIRGKIS